MKAATSRFAMDRLKFTTAYPIHMVTRQSPTLSRVGAYVHPVSLSPIRSA